MSDSINRNTGFSFTRIQKQLAHQYGDRPYPTRDTHRMMLRIDLAGNKDLKISSHELEKFKAAHPELQLPREVLGLPLAKIDEYVKDHPEVREKATLERLSRGFSHAYQCDAWENRGWGEKTLSFLFGWMFDPGPPEFGRLDCP